MHSLPISPSVPGFLHSAPKHAPNAVRSLPNASRQGLPCRRVLAGVKPVVVRSSSAAAPEPANIDKLQAFLDTSGPGGDGNGGDSGFGGRGGRGDGNGASGGAGAGQPIDPQLAAILAAAGRSVDSFPSDFVTGLLSGKVTPDVLRRFLELESNFWAKFVWGIAGFRERLLADPSFPVKMGIEIGIGIVMKITAEYTKRQESFAKEIDFVAANTLMAIIADFMLTWLPAPTLSFKPKVVTSNALLNFFARCPDNAFQRVPPGMEPFTFGQRVGAIVRNGSKLLGVGFCASMIGVGVTNALIFMRQQLDPNNKAQNGSQNVIATSAAYGVYMSISSNLRYQIIAGIVEERGIETIFKGQHQLCHLLSFIARTGNTFIGSLLWVDFVRLCGMQKAPESKLKAAIA